MKVSTRKMAVAGLLGAVSIAMGLIPGIGFIPVPTPAGAATIMHIPAIIGGVAEGPGVGLFVGFIFGLMSLLRATTPLFADPLVAILPRLFIGVSAYFAFVGLRRFGLTPGLIGAAVAGTLTNTVLVLTMLVLRGYIPAEVGVTLGLLHGTPEVVIGSIIVVAVGLGLSRAGYVRPAIAPPTPAPEPQKQTV